MAGALLLALLFVCCTAERAQDDDGAGSPDLDGAVADGESGPAEGEGEGEGGGAAPYTGQLPDKAPLGSLVTADGFALVGELSLPPTDAPSPAPVVVLAHDMGQTRLRWAEISGFVEQLRRHGYATVTFDLRGHGESKLQELTGLEAQPCWQPEQCRSRQCSDGRCTAPAGDGEPVEPRRELRSFQQFTPEDWAALVLDLQTVHQTVRKLTQSGWPVDAERMVYVGADLAANAVLRFLAELEPGEVLGAVLVSPVQEGVDRLGGPELTALAAQHEAGTLAALAAGGDMLARNALTSLSSGAPSAETVLLSGLHAHGSQLLVQSPEARSQVVSWLAGWR